MFPGAAWAIRTGHDLYEVVSDNGWHYNYPPLLAAALQPLADPPRGYDKTEFLPYSISVALWYLINLGLTLWAVHHLANALQERSDDPALRGQLIGGRRWWALRLWPLVVCVIPAGHSLMRGQANMLVLALFCIALAALLSQQRFRAGAAIALAACLKVFPIFLLVYPVWRRDFRCLAGAAAGMLLWLIVLPLPWFGVDGLGSLYQKYIQVTLGPAFHLGDDASRQTELLGAGGTTDNQTLKVAIHHLLPRGEDEKPLARVSPWLEWTCRLIGAGMTLLTLLGCRRLEGAAGMMPWAVFLMLMLVLCPVCHLHYFVFLIPVVMVIMVRRWECQGGLWLGWRWHGLFAAFMIAVLLPNLPQMEILRNLGLPTWIVLMIWASCLILPGSGGRKPSERTPQGAYAPRSLQMKRAA